ncbi:Fc.00g047590.m01.CDS01 [Cosmosporella sp. VM-42]
MKFSRACLAVASVAATFTSATPMSLDSLEEGEGGLVRRAEDFFLRIMPLGASITFGLTSSDNNGYRKGLRDQLRFDGWQVNMVGSVKNGNMVDKDTEGWSGYRVDQVLPKAQASVPTMKPNVVLINAGTNDAGQNYQIDTVQDRMRGLIEYILGQVPDTVIVLSTLVASKANQPRTDTINAKYRTLAQTMRSEGKHIVLADMADGFITLSDIGTDGVHPTDGGYKKMAAVWNKAINTAYGLNWLKAPIASNNVGTWGDDGAIVDPNLPEY